MDSSELKALFTIDSIGANVNKEELEKLLGKDTVDSLIEKQCVSVHKNEHGNWLVVLSIGEIIIDRIVKLAQLISLK